MKKIVMKFGGSSVATGENIHHVATLVADCAKQGYAVVVVVSALDGMTDELYEIAEQAKKGGEASIREFKQKTLKRHSAAAAKAINNMNIRKEVENGNRKHGG